MSLLDALIGPPRNNDSILQSQTAEAQEEGEVEPQATTPEVLAVSVLAEIQPDEAHRIVTMWRDLLGVKLDPGKVREHLQALSNWQSQWQRIRS